MTCKVVETFLFQCKMCHSVLIMTCHAADDRHTHTYTYPCQEGDADFHKV